MLRPGSKTTHVLDCLLSSFLLLVGDERVFPAACSFSPFLLAFWVGWGFVNSGLGSFLGSSLSCLLRLVEQTLSKRLGSFVCGVDGAFGGCGG